jgi:amino acid permease
MTSNPLEFVGEDYRAVNDDRSASLIKHADASPGASVHLKAIVLTTSSIGLSVLVYPESVGKTGLTLWLKLFFLAIVYNYLACYLLIQSAAKAGVETTDGIYLRVFGRGKFLIKVLKAAVELGTITSCLLLVNQVLIGFAWLAPDALGESPEIDMAKWVGRHVIINLLIFLVLKRHCLKDFEVVSLCVAAGVLFFSFVSLVRAFWSDISLNSLYFSNYAQVSDSFSVLLIGFMSQDQIIDVFSNLRTSRKRSMLRALKIQTGFLTVFYAAVAVFGFLSFQSTTDNVLGAEGGSFLQRHPAVVVMNTLLGALVVHTNAKLLLKAKNKIQLWFESYNILGELHCKALAIFSTQATVTLALCVLEYYQVNFESLLEVLSKYLATVLCLLVPMIIYGKIFDRGGWYFTVVVIWFVSLMLMLNVEQASRLWAYLTH